MKRSEKNMWIRRGACLVAVAVMAFIGACGGGATLPDYEITKPPAVVLGKSARLVDVDLAELESELRSRASKDMRAAVQSMNRCTYSGNYGYDYNYDTTDSASGDILASPSTGGSAPSVSADMSMESGSVQFTDTNIQEEGVDEADLVKTDGELAYVLSQGKLRIFRVWPFSEFGSLSEMEIEGDGDSIYLADDKVVVFSNTTFEEDSGQYIRAVKVTILDVSDPEAPQVLRESYYQGELINSRRIGTKVHIVLNNRFVMPQDVMLRVDESLIPTCETLNDGDNREILESATQELTVENEEVIAEAELEEFLPRIVHEGVDLDSAVSFGLKKSELNDGEDLISMISFDLDNLSGADSMISVLGRGSLVYASRDSIYVTQEVNSWEMLSSDLPVDEITLIHRFDISAKRVGPHYFGSGSVAGHLLSASQNNAQFSMSEYEGFLRVATTIGQVSKSQFNSTSNVYVLDASDQELSMVGGVSGLAKGEQIYSVRFIGPRGFVVTFKKVDPLFTMDLSNPNEPQVVGELKVPGFSTYLHPYDYDHLIGLGKDAQDMGSFAWFQGVKMSLFAVGDMASPREVHNTVIGSRGTDSEALHEHHAFTFDQRRDLVALPITLYEGGSGGSSMGQFKYSGLQLFRVTPETGFELMGEVKLQGGYGYGYSYDYGKRVRRSIIIGNGTVDGLITVMNDGIALHAIDENMTEVGSAEWVISDVDAPIYDL